MVELAHHRDAFLGRPASWPTSGPGRAIDSVDVRLYEAIGGHQLLGARGRLPPLHQGTNSHFGADRPPAGPRTECGRGDHDQDHGAVDDVQYRRLETEGRQHRVEDRQCQRPGDRPM